MPLLLVILLASGVSGAPAPAAPAAGRTSPPAPAFSGRRAMEWLERQCALGPRVPGTPAHAAFREMVARACDSLGLRLDVVPLTAPDPLRGGTVDLYNLVIAAGPSTGTPVWLGAHYDSRPVCDREPDPERARRPLPGANDGASGTAILLHLAELVARQPPPRPVRLLLLDGEDLGRAHEPETFCQGSRYLAEHWNDFGSPLAGPPPSAVVILDMVGRRGLQVLREATSNRLAPRVMDTLFRQAAELGLTVFVDAPGRAVYDDHIPFLRVGLPAVDLVDLDDPHWHTLADVPENCSEGSLGEVGRLMVAFLYAAP